MIAGGAALELGAGAGRLQALADVTCITSRGFRLARGEYRRVSGRGKRAIDARTRASLLPYSVVVARTRYLRSKALQAGLFLSSSPCLARLGREDTTLHFDRGIGTTACEAPTR